MTAAMTNQCADRVLEYLVAQNRPYSANDVTQNLHNEHSKAQVGKALEQLAADGRISEKENGKQRVYCALQSGGAANPEEEARESRELDAAIAAATQNLNAVEQQAREAEAQLRKLLEQSTTGDAEAEVAAMETRLQRLRAKLADLTDNCIKVSPEDNQRVQREHDTVLREYRKRKRMCNNALNSILEGYDKSKKELIEELDLTTDEDAGVKL